MPSSRSSSDRKSTRLNSSHLGISYAVFCLKKKLDALLPKEIDMVHGPCCPVCVTPLELIDKAEHIAQRPDVIFASFGDILFFFNNTAPPGFFTLPLRDVLPI